MSKLQQILKSLQAITVEQQEEDLLRIIRSRSREITELNTDQLLQGIDSEGRSLGEYASEYYARFKKKLNPLAGGKPDLKLRGHFHNSFFIDADQFPVTFLADDEKTETLIDLKGEDIFGLTEGSKEVARHDILKEYIQEYYRKLLSQV